MSQLQVTGEAKIRDIQGPVVANSGVISALNGAANQYVRGDGALASFPTVTGGGSSVSFYLNGSVNQGTFGGSTYYQLGENAITGTGTNFSTSTNGLLAQFITDANVPDQTEIPSGNWNIEFYMGVSASSGALASFYVEIYKYDGTTFTLVGTNVATPEFLTNTTTIDAYFTSVAMPLTTLNQTDRIAVRVFANVASKTVTLYTEDNRLCQVVTTFSRGVLSINNLTDQQQYFAVGTSGTNFNIASSVDTHTFNLPVASATNTGKLSSSDWSVFNNKVPYTGANANVDLGVYNLSSRNLTANGNAGSSGSLHLKQNDTINVAGINYGTIATNTLQQFVFYWENASFAKRFNLDFSALTALGTAKTFTLPDLSGTLALLEGSQTFSGAKTFSSFDTTFSQGFFSDYAIKIKKGGSITLVNGYVSIGEISGTGTSRILFGDGNSAFSNSLLFNTTSDKIYTFPNTSGTLALTSDLGAYVTLATTQTISGAKTFSSSPIIDNGTSGIPLRFKQYTSTNFGLAGYTDIIPVGASLIAFSFGQTGANTKTAYFSAANLVNNTPREYIMPNADGTIALLSDLGAYLPLSGGTLTGPLSGTTATFSGLGTFYQLTMTGATAGRIFYAQTGGVVSQSGNLNWNETNGMLGVGTPNPSAVITAFSTNAATQFKAAGTAPAFTFSNTLTSPTLGCVFGLATSANHFITGTAAGDMAIANQSTTAGAIVFGTGTAEKMRMSASGRLLVGTSVDSGALFQVAGAATFSSSVTATKAILGASTATSSVANLEVFGSTQVSTNYGQIRINDSVTTSKTMSLGVDGANNVGFIQSFQDGIAYRSLILNGLGGNVGIGTSSPATEFGYTILSINNATYGGLLDFSNNNTLQGRIGADTTGMYIQAKTSIPMIFYTANTERMRITSGGRVGIADSNPNMLLSLGTTTGRKVHLYNDGGGANDIGGGLGVDMAGFSAETSIFFGNYSGSGRLTIGAWTTSQTYSTKLTILANGSIGAPSGTNIYNPSDLRLKKNIETITNGLDKIISLNPVKFNWIDGFDLSEDGKDMLGFIAQEVKDIIPEAVEGFSNGSAIVAGEITVENPLRVNEKFIIPVLVKAIQEQTKIIKDLEARIKQLENK